MVSIMGTDNDKIDAFDAVIISFKACGFNPVFILEFGGSSNIITD
jgi:hypothetical protein